MNYNFDEEYDRRGTSCVKWDHAEAFLGEKDLLPMWVADMDFRTPGFITEAVLQRAAHEVYGYTVRPESYYNSIARWIGKLHGWQVDRDWIVFSPGIVPAVNLAVMAFTQPGDRIIVQPPVYFPFFSAVKDHGRELIYNPLKLEQGRYFMDFENLRNLTGPWTRMIILSNPHNPGGSAWTKQELEQLGEICIRHNLLLLSDEIHSDLAIPPFRHTVAASISEEIASRTITLMAPSKTFNLAGMSTSSVIIPDRENRKIFQDMINRLHLNGGNIFGMVASEAAYTHGESWLRQMLAYVKGNLDFMEDYIHRHIPSVHLIRPEATYLAWLDFRELGFNDEGLRRFILEEARLGLSDGPLFGPGGSGFQRINVACPRSILQEAMHRLEKAFTRLP